MITNIRTNPTIVCATTNGGHQTSTLVGDFKNLGTVWYNPNSIANILSLSEVRKVCRVTMDTTADAAMVIHREDGSTMKFVNHTNGLYYFDTHIGVPNDTLDRYSPINTVTDNKKLFVAREIDAADMARDLYSKLGCALPTEI
jgi:hypothetical protein